MVSQSDLDELIDNGIINSHSKYELFYNKDARWGKYEIYEYIKIYNTDGKLGIGSRQVEYFETYSEALEKFCELTNQTKIVIMSSGRID